MNINLISYYDHFPNHKPLPFEPCIDMYNDNFVRESTEGSCALLIEPRSICPKAYEYVEKNWNKFRYIFTHDSKLLNICDNAKLILWGVGNANYSCFSNVKKTKLVSMVSSNKELCELHIARKALARKLKSNPNVDVMGTVDGGLFKNTFQIYAEYKFSIAFENYIDDYWFTEKICNCFANRTIPIYYGAKKIDELFNGQGIIHCHSVEDIVEVVESPKMLRYIYDSDIARKAMEDNFNRVKQYTDFETWFFKEYGELLNEC